MVTPMVDLNPQHQRRNGSVGHPTIPSGQEASYEGLGQEGYLDLHYEQIRDSQMAETSSVSSHEYIAPSPLKRGWRLRVVHVNVI